MTERRKPPAQPDTSVGVEPGRLERDEQGNVTWQWADDLELQADGTVGAEQRMRALINPRLSIKDDEDTSPGPIQVNDKGLQHGYDPYDSGALSKESWKKKKDLRKLSEWIELRKKLEGGKKNGG